MNFSKLDRNDTLLYKGIAILMIVLHNFMHLFPSPKEMEFSFYDDRFSIFVDSLSVPQDIIRVLFSYFGHFGVQVFVFLSAYGLTKRYENEIITFWKYIKKRVVTIYPSFLLAIILFTLVSADWELGILAPLKVVYWQIDLYVYKILMLSNFIPGQEFSLVGPWWFLSFIFQFYLVFPLLLRATNKWGNRILIIISVLAIMINILVHGEFGGINLYFTVLGHLPELCLGILFAKKDSDNFYVPNFVVLIAVTIFLFGNVFEPIWYLTHVSFLMLLIFFFCWLKTKIILGTFTHSFFIFFGRISMPLFLVNGFLREPFLSLAQNYGFWLSTILLCIISCVVSVCVSLVLMKLEKHLLVYLSLIRNKYSQSRMHR